MSSKAPLGLQGQWDGERSCRMLRVSHWQDKEESRLQDSRGLSQLGPQPLPSPSELPPRAKGTTLGANLRHSLQILSFLAKDCNGVEGLAGGSQH